MNKPDVAAAALVTAGALNWGLADAFHLDRAVTLFGMRFRETSVMSSVMYGLAGMYQALTRKSIQSRRCFANE